MLTNRQEQNAPAGDRDRAAPTGGREAIPGARTTRDPSPLGNGVMEPSGICSDTRCPFNSVLDTKTGERGRFLHRHETDGSVQSVWL